MTVPVAARRSQSSIGTLPVRDVPGRNKNCKLLNSRNSDGIVPVIPGLSRRSKVVIPDITPYSIGIVPVNKLKESLIVSAECEPPEVRWRQQLATDAAKRTKTYQNVN
jgi:hypothetical protein